MMKVLVIAILYSNVLVPVYLDGSLHIVLRDN